MSSVTVVRRLNCEPRARVSRFVSRSALASWAWVSYWNGWQSEGGCGRHGEIALWRCAIEYRRDA